MTITECIDEFVNTKEVMSPIFTNDVYKYVQSKIKDVKKSTVNMSLRRYEKKHPYFLRYQKGIYYKTADSIFGGLVPINYKAIMFRKYLGTQDNIIGYETGASLINQLGLSTQVPRCTFIASNKTRYEHDVPNAFIHLVKPVIKITNENVRYLQFLDLLSKENRWLIEVPYYLRIFKEFIRTYHLTFKKLCWYAQFYRQVEIYEGLAELVDMKSSKKTS